jgi:replicative DNA helicase
MTGFHSLDNLTLGFLPGELWILAGGTSMGKTAFALQAAQHVAETAGPVAIFTLEMMKEELIWRMLCAEACVDGQEYRRRKGKIGEQGEAALAMAAAHLNKLPIYLDETSVVTVNHVRANARRMAATAGLSLIVVDHLQIMEETDGENRNLALAAMSRGLKALAKDLRVPVIALSQLSRFKDRADKRPQLSDLRESGAIEQDANGVIMLFRPEYYYGPTDRDGNSIKGKAEAIIGKSRNGATGTADLYFREEFARFENLTFRNHP